MAENTPEQWYSLVDKTLEVAEEMLRTALALGYEPAVGSLIAVGAAREQVREDAPEPAEDTP